MADNDRAFGVTNKQTNKQESHMYVLLTVLTGKAIYFQNPPLRSC